ncbi:LysR family transcriptional regulator [Aliivibrio finisterrensis]|uniref:LysR family transcriptional regulator n=1 Tax=Aliivibrio finisterrensis TaxID=511998 RepID=A0A4Q5L0A4_9GAMM|nr:MULTISPECIES: LysR family transcriptional regulator [Aliivibrio]MDD9177313.1 LysR family transcriptional regulator [Aliivibrio sp. A6]RYU54797.1 LysR family transcriptional regulator [Aliivibrio finisterrensis]RYU56471.1 LysR family transcriptional regulator [Aliivibrio finisterrensis]RYU61592.1 LysR family transcriptional regulator [Aliivibrio finisterrensis]RYU66819.1 LysR family transcriptional regulator [Aliivibrio finisterrensis]
MNWTLDQLNAFVTSVKCGSFSAAARKMGKAQSRISTAIANLEADLGFDLFDRSARLPVLTQDGEDMFIEAQAILEQCERLQARADTVATGEEIALTVALDEAVPIDVFEDYFQKLSLKFPLLKLTIINGSQADIAEWVDDKKADLGFLFRVNTLSDSLEYLSLGFFNQALIVSPQHPLAKIEKPTLVQLNQHRQLVIRDRVGHSHEKAISANHWYIDSYYYITALVIRNVGWALVPEHVLESDWYRNQTTRLSAFHIPDALQIEIGVVKRRDSGMGNVMEWMLDEIEHTFEKL